MRSLLWIELDGFYADGYGNEMPLVVSRAHKVLDANPLARARGVRLGIEIRQAKALVDGLVVKPWKVDRFVDPQRRWLDLCAEFTGLIQPEDQHQASLDLSDHPDPFDIAEKIVRCLVSETACAVKFGIAVTKWVARLAAEHDAHNGSTLERDSAFLGELPVSLLTPVQDEHRERLHFLGYRTIGEVAKLPIEVLRRQFGREALTIRQAATGTLYEPVIPSYPPDSVHEAMLFAEAIESTETLDQILKSLARRVGDRLTTKNQQGSKVTISFELEDTKKVVRQRTFTKPVRCPVTALASLRLLIPSFNQPIVAVRVTVQDLELVRHRQGNIQGFVCEGERKPNPQSVLKYVRTVYGDQAVQLGKDIEVPRRVRVLREWKNATGWR
jgi:DNA polymerase IV